MSLKSFLSHITHYDKTVERFRNLSDKEDIIIAQQQELIMAHKYHDTVADYEWLKYKGISPGGWAIDYAFCYTLARTLNAMHPQNIIECGLGQSSRLVHQYSNFFNVQATTIEHDEKWIEFLKKEIGNKYPIKIQKVEIEETEYKGERTLTYKNFSDIINKESFDLILIDGPFGSPHYSRPQAISLCQNNIKERFCIIIDDSERKGEQETVEEIKNTLAMMKHDYVTKVYSSIKSHTLICSKDLSFLASL